MLQMDTFRKKILRSLSQLLMHNICYFRSNFAFKYQVLVHMELRKKKKKNYSYTLREEMGNMVKFRAQ